MSVHRSVSMLALVLGCSLMAQDTKTDKTKVKVAAPGAAQDPNNRPAPIQITQPPASAAGGRPAQLIQPQLDDLEKRVLALEALVEKQKTLVAGLGSQVSMLQQDNTKLWAKTIALELVAKEYKTHRHNPTNNLGQTMQGNFHMVVTTSPDSLNAPTTGPIPGK